MSDAVYFARVFFFMLGAVTFALVAFFAVDDAVVREWIRGAW